MDRIKKLKILFLVWVLVFTSMPLVASADVNIGGKTVPDLICKSGETIQTCLPRLFNIVYILAGVFAMALLVIYGYQYMSAGGDGQQMKAARERLTGLVSGIAILSITYILLQFLNPQFTNIRNPVGLTGSNTSTSTGSGINLTTMFVNITSPANGATISGNARILGEVSSHASDGTLVGIGKLELYWKSAANPTYQKLSEITPTEPLNTNYIFPVTTTSLPDGVYNFQIKATDINQTVAHSLSLTVTIKNH